MTTLQEAARLAIEALTYCEALNSSMIERKRAALNALRTALAQQVEQKPVAVSDAMVEAYLTAQRKTVEEADRFGRPNAGGLHTNTVREACRNGISAALAAAPAPHDAAICCGVIIRQSLLHGV